MSRHNSLIALVFACILVSPLQAQELHNLQLKLLPGTVMRVTSRIQARVWIEMPDRSNLTATVLELQSRHEVTDVDSAGNMLLRVSYEWVTMKRREPSGEVNYDSRVHAGEMPVQAASAGASVGESYEVLLNPQGRVIEIQGMQEMMQRMLDKIRLRPPDSKRVEMEIRDLFEPERMEAVIEGTRAIYPGRTVQLGDEWQAQHRITLFGQGLLPIVYKLTGTEQGEVTIRMTGEMNDESELPALDSDPFTHRLHLDGRLAGVIVVDESTGIPRNWELSSDLVGHMTVKDRRTAREVQLPMRSEITLRIITE